MIEIWSFFLFHFILLTEADAFNTFYSIVATCWPGILKSDWLKLYISTANQIALFQHSKATLKFVYDNGYRLL